MLTTTLNRIKEHDPCTDGWEKLLKHLGKTKPDDELLPYSVIVESNGLDDALWCCRVEPQYHKEWRLFAVWCCVQVKHLMTDERSLKAIEVAERYANGEATDDELRAAWDAAGPAAGDAAGDAAWTARDAAWTAAWTAAREAAWAAAGAAREAAWAAAEAAGAAWEAAGTAAGEAQKKEFLKVVGED